MKNFFILSFIFACLMSSCSFGIQSYRLTEIPSDINIFSSRQVIRFMQQKGLFVTMPRLVLIEEKNYQIYWLCNELGTSRQFAVSLSGGYHCIKSPYTVFNLKAPFYQKGNKFNIIVDSLESTCFIKPLNN